MSTYPVKERPILFNGDMVRAILSGRKTQTRRAVKGAVLFADMASELQEHRELLGWDELIPGYLIPPCPFGQPGDRLWVRETTVRVEEYGYVGPVHVASQAGQDIINWGLAPAPDDCTEVEPHEIKLRPAIHMPRSMCRIVLEITSVRVDRLQAITEADALAEGVDPAGPVGYIPASERMGRARYQFANLWDAIGGDWSANPWVWVVEFKRAEEEGACNA